MGLNIKEMVEKLHPFELQVLPFLRNHITEKELSEKTGLKEVEVMRALQWLENKNVLKITTEEKKIIGIGENGKKYLKQGFPEKRVLEFIKSSNKSFDEIKSSLGLDDEEFNVCVGALKKKAAINIKNNCLEITEQGRSILEKVWLEELFLEKVAAGKIYENDLLPEERFSYNTLKKRKEILKDITVKIKRIELKEIGERLSKEKIIRVELIDKLTPDLLKKGEWRNKRFRKYDVSINVPKICGGKRHFVSQTIEYIKKVWLEMGFKEMRGPLLDTSFWNFDALFTAQDHPVRELHDTFYIKDPPLGKLPDKKIVKRVKEMHEYGGNIGSLGWRYNWNEIEAKKNVLRTHTTILSARTIASLKKADLPSKFFSVAKCFRNESLDWSHLFEFYQVEGIVVDPDANFRNLIGYLKEFFKKLGYEKVRIRPAYFPYTEPSAEVEVFHPIKKEWIELAGSGIFRPEVVVPLLGEDVPVLAWGMGLERSIAEFFNITDIRKLYSNDLKMLREIKIWEQF
ncbi:MAG: phenylalanine--tRNA ligase subunit alpha [Candidatus Woesearchaeota archaeon]|nr:phenylalanine--tRNA ligase subunit alpha [Candidatus Woesearchaeota archaeon]